MPSHEEGGSEYKMAEEGLPRSSEETTKSLQSYFFAFRT